MPTYIVTCPYCHTSRNATQNSIVTCSNPSCRATLHIDNNGKIKKSKSGKK